MTGAAVTPPRPRPFYQFALFSWIWVVEVIVDLLALVLLPDQFRSTLVHVPFSLTALVVSEWLARRLARQGHQIAIIEPIQFRLSTLCALMFAAAILVGLNAIPLRTIENSSPVKVVINGQVLPDKTVCYGFPSTHYSKLYLNDGTQLPSEPSLPNIRINAIVAVGALIMLGVLIERRGSKQTAVHSGEAPVS